MVLCILGSYLNFPSARSSRLYFLFVLTHCWLVFVLGRLHSYMHYIGASGNPHTIALCSSLYSRLPFRRVWLHCSILEPSWLFDNYVVRLFDLPRVQVDLSMVENDHTNYLFTTRFYRPYTRQAVKQWTKNRIMTSITSAQTPIPASSDPLLTQRIESYPSGPTNIFGAPIDYTPPISYHS